MVKILLNIGGKNQRTTSTHYRCPFSRINMIPNKSYPLPASIYSRFYKQKILKNPVSENNNHLPLQSYSSSFPLSNESCVQLTFLAYFSYQKSEVVNMGTCFLPYHQENLSHMVLSTVAEEFRICFQKAYYQGIYFYCSASCSFLVSILLY